MTMLLLAAMGFAMACLGLAMLFASIRMFRGPTAQDRVMAMDTLYVCAMMMMLVLGMRYGSQLYFEMSLLVALLLVLAGCLAVTEALGLLRLSNFYQRIHGPALLNSLGAGCVLIASMLYFSALQSRPVIHELLITVFMVLTAPVTAILCDVTPQIRRPQARDGVRPAGIKQRGRSCRRWQL